MDAQAAAEMLWPGRAKVVTPLSGGITNLNYRIDVDGRSYVLRMGGARTDLLGIDRNAEGPAAERAAQVGGPRGRGRRGGARRRSSASWRLRPGWSPSS